MTHEEYCDKLKVVRSWLEEKTGGLKVEEDCYSSFIVYVSSFGDMNDWLKDQIKDRRRCGQTLAYFDVDTKELTGGAVPVSSVEVMWRY